MCDLLGHSLEELLRQSFADYAHPGDTTADAEFMLRLIAGEVPSYQVERRCVHGGGHEVWLTVTTSLVRDVAGHPEYLVAVAEGISGRKRAAIALREMESGLRAAQVEVLDRLAQAAELRDDDTGLHTQRVGILSAQIASALGMSSAEVELIRAAAPLHDVGKIGVPDSVLLKSGKLTVAERASIQRHALEGARILSGSTAPLTRLAESIARSHHERWDGRGYPHGLRGEAIPFAARIVAVADVFDALSHDRPYRSAYPLDTAIEKVRAGSGTHFDPRVVDAFLRVHGRMVPGSNLHAGEMLPV